ncbi:MAG: hypothetical protein MPW15_18085 [Candidatus Manganitrophus sp.]|nr:hypothetical protein [Candidatus Manganitrophus sp.]
MASPILVPPGSRVRTTGYPRVSMGVAEDRHLRGFPAPFDPFECDKMPLHTTSETIIIMEALLNCNEVLEWGVPPPAGGVAPPPAQGGGPPGAPPAPHPKGGGKGGTPRSVVI